ncbi:MAG: aldehyde ferredoxin oxidoreductase C-terminal domain-containing protein [Chloroflexota bacterium]
MINGGYTGKILRVNLTTGKIKTEKLPDESILRKYVGCFGLGLWYLLKELPTGVGALEPENPLIFTNGPLIGARVPCPNNCTLTTLNGDTQFTAGRSHTHGWFGPYLKMAGYDGLIVTGASKKWVYLWIDDDKIELRDAAKFLGKDTHETEDLIKADLGVPKKAGAKGGASVAAIGPAGENLCAGASIENDKNHAFSHSGVGRIMGSKRLKAIAIRGSGEAPVSDAEKVKTIGVEWTRLATKVRPPGPGISLSDYKLIKGTVGIAARNWLQNDIPGFGDRMSKQKLTPVPCYRCPLACAYDAEPVEGPYKGHVFTLSGGGENLEGAASIVGVGARDPGEIWYLTDLDDRLGLESATVGCSMAVAFEAYEKGLLTTKDTDGLELKWGDIKVIETLVKRIAHREGRFASMLADGPLVAAQRVGLPEAAVHIKGTGMNMHDWRRTWGVLLGQVIGGGVSWPSLAADLVGSPDAGYPQRSDPLDPFIKAEEVAKTGILKAWYDCQGTCDFSCWSIRGSLKLASSAVAAAVGWEDFTPEEALVIGHRVLTLERIFNMAHGLTADDDIKVSPRILSPSPADAGPAAGKSIAPYLEGWVRDYYERLGWDRRTGKPMKSTLHKLSLEEFINIVWD